MISDFLEFKTFFALKATWKGRFQKANRNMTLGFEAIRGAQEQGRHHHEDRKLKLPVG